MINQTTRPATPVQHFVPQPSLDVEAIQREIAAGYINEQPHPSAQLRIVLDGDKHAGNFHPTWKLEYL